MYVAQAKLGLSTVPRAGQIMNRLEAHLYDSSHLLLVICSFRGHATPFLDSCLNEQLLI